MSLVETVFNKAVSSFSIGERARVALAVSGGADSMALAVCAEEYAKHHGWDLTIFTVDHGLRTQSRQDAEFVAFFAKSRGIKCEILTWIGEKPTSGIEKNARDKRYALLFEACRKHQIPHLFLGHHKQDQAETFLMRRARHSGEIGLAAMSAVKSFSFGKMYRPFLGILPADLRAFNDEHQIEWKEDPTNQTDQFERGRLRRIMSPEMIENAFEQTVLYGQKRRLVEEKVAAFYAQYLTVSNYGYALLPQTAFIAADSEIVCTALSEILRVIANKPYAPDAESVKRVVASLTFPDFRGCTIGGCRIAPSTKKQVLVWREESDVPPPVDFTDENYVYWDRFAVFPTNLKNKNLKVGKIGNQLKSEKFTPKRVFSVLPMIFDNQGLFIIPHLMYKQNQISCQALFAPTFPLILKPEWTCPIIF